MVGLNLQLKKKKNLIIKHANKPCLAVWAPLSISLVQTGLALGLRTDTHLCLASFPQF